MLKVVISDDEELICRLVQALADWKALGMEVAGVASNGLEALELIREVRPDILITDIRMPGCGGLELIERAKKLQPQLEVIIISGYAHFEYAQSAIKFGVGNYLLKPINKEELTSTLEMLGERCRARRTEHVRAFENQESRQKDRERIRRSLISDVLRGAGGGITRDSLETSYYFKGDGEYYRIFLIKIDCSRKSISKPALETIQDKIKKTVTAGIGKLSRELVFEFEEYTGYGIVNYNEDERGKLDKGYRNVQNELEGQKDLWGNVALSMALGTEVSNPARLLDSVKMAREILLERFQEGTGGVLKKRPKGCGLSSQVLTEQYKRMIDDAVEKMSLEKADMALLQFRQRIGGIPGICGRELFGAVLEAGKVFAIGMGSGMTEEQRKEYLADLDQCGKSAELFDTLKNFQRETMENLLEQKKNETGRPVRIAKRYIMEHFNEPITLEEICEATGFSVSYFSAMFKKETGEGFSKYLTRVRIDEAKNLLRETNLPVSEICEKVGYNDRKHFTSVFHKATGLNPAEFRKLYG